MSLFGWLRGQRNGSNRQRDEWRKAWAAAVEADDASRVEALRLQLEPLNTPGEDVEVELEMLDALERLGAIYGPSEAGTLPTVETQHRVLGGDVCHFTAPASLPDDPAQASGRVLFTATRTIFVGGAQKPSLPWHAVREVVRSDRDVLFVRPDGSASAHFRFNTYGDAVVAAFLARRLKGQKGTRVL